MLSLPIALRLPLAAPPQLVTPVLPLEQRVLARHLLDRAGLKAYDDWSGAIAPIQRFGSAAKLIIHLHCLVLDSVYRYGAAGVPVARLMKKTGLSSIRLSASGWSALVSGHGRNALQEQGFERASFSMSTRNWKCKGTPEPSRWRGTNSGPPGPGWSACTACCQSGAGGPPSSTA